MYHLSVSFIPLTAEAERIRRCRRRVFALKDEPEVARVWLPNDNSPGLAMARALGDFCLKNFGLISVPDLSCLCLSEKDEFIVLATDGVSDTHLEFTACHLPYSVPIFYVLSFTSFCVFFILHRSGMCCLTRRW